MSQDTSHQRPGSNCARVARTCDIEIRPWGDCYIINRCRASNGWKDDAVGEDSGVAPQAARIWSINWRALFHFGEHPAFMPLPPTFTSQ